MAECTPTGLVTTLELTGEVAVMARYQGQVGVFRATIPLGIDVDEPPPVKNFVDECVFDKLKTLGVPPSPLCDDSTFLRRVTVDLAGRLPTPEETEAFLADADPDKRDRLIDEFARQRGICRLLRQQMERHPPQQAAAMPRTCEGTYAFHEWIRDSLYENKPYDQFVREILTATGELG